MRAVDANNMQPKIDRRFAFADTLLACDYFASAAHIGKVVITG